MSSRTLSAVAVAAGCLLATAVAAQAQVLPVPALPVQPPPVPTSPGGPTTTGAVATRALLARTTLTDTERRPLDGRGTSVAIVDTGIDPAHPAFRLPDGGSKVVQMLSALPCLADGQQLGPYDVGGVHVPAITQTKVSDGPGCVTPVPNVNLDTGQGGHGSMIGGIIDGDAYTLSDGTVVGGVAPGARLVVISTTTALIGIDNAFEWVLANHAHPCGAGVPESTCPPIRVVNCSWGADEAALTTLQDRLAHEGVLTVWANGNQGGDGSSSTSNVQGTADRTPGVLSAANYDDGGTGTRDGRLDPGSSRGAANDPRTWPDISAPATNIVSACRAYQAVCPAIETEQPRSGPGSNDVDTYFTGSGTSFAAPVVDAVIAMLFQADPDASAAEVAAAIETTAYRFQAGAPYAVQPFGNYLSSYDKGAGLIDAYAAARALGARPVHNGGSDNDGNIGASHNTDAAASRRTQHHAIVSS
jgi:serine protease AprX